MNRYELWQSKNPRVLRRGDVVPLSDIPLGHWAWLGDARIRCYQAVPSTGICYGRPYVHTPVVSVDRRGWMGGDFADTLYVYCGPEPEFV